MRWSELETLKFVKIYLRHEYLWNPYDPGYKCRNKRQEAYGDIIAEFHSATGILMDEVDLRIKIKNLRSTYSQEVAKIRQRSSPDYVYTPSIKWFGEWHRCFNNIKEKISSSGQQEVGEDTNQKWVQPKELPSPPHVTQSDDYSHSFKTETHEPSPERDHSSYKMKRKKFKHRNSSSDHFKVDSTVNTVKEDEFDIYGKYIASQLRSMDLPRALRIQLEIHSIVSQARMSSLSGN